MAALDAPHIFINEYLKSKIAASFDFGMPFYPTLPADINNIDSLDIPVEPVSAAAETETRPTAGHMAVYDRMFKLRRQAFPMLKYEQVLYYFYSYTSDQLQKIQQTVQDLLDYGDISASELNSWIKLIWKSKGEHTDVNGRPILYFGQTAPADTNDWFAVPFFHEIKIFQLEESRDIVDFGTARTFAGNKIIVDYCWHHG